MTLKALQEEMKDHLFFRDRAPRTSALWGNAVPDRLRVYRNNTRTNWTNALDHDFPLTRKQFSEEAWELLRRRYLTRHPPRHWELNTSMSPFVAYLQKSRLKPYVKELADFEWRDLCVFIDRSLVRHGLGTTNPTAVVRYYRHQIFFWAEDGAPSKTVPKATPEVLVFYRDSKNTTHIEEADPLLLLMMDHFKTPKAKLDELEAVRRKLLPKSTVSLRTVFDALQAKELLLV